MATTTMTSKGQVTIPLKIRELLQLHTGDKIDISVTENGEAIIRPLTKRVDDLYGRLHRTDQKPLTVDAMQEAIATRFKRDTP